MDSKEFQALSQMISDDSQIIKAIELAPDGVVKDIYPLKGNEAAFGIDMLNSPARKHEANLAMKSGQYTIAGPYELNQGGLGSLLFEPIYITDKSGEKSFWGFKDIPPLILSTIWKNWNWISLPMLPTVIRCGKKTEIPERKPSSPRGEMRFTKELYRSAVRSQMTPGILRLFHIPDGLP